MFGRVIWHARLTLAWCYVWHVTPSSWLSYSVISNHWVRFAPLLDCSTKWRPGVSNMSRIKPYAPDGKRLLKVSCQRHWSSSTFARWYRAKLCFRCKRKLLSFLPLLLFSKCSINKNMQYIVFIPIQNAWIYSMLYKGSDYIIWCRGHSNTPSSGEIHWIISLLSIITIRKDELYV